MQKAKRYIYHYYAHLQWPYTGKYIDVDGIANMEEEIDNMDAYRKLIQIIAKDNEFDVNRVTIRSLSLLKIC